MVSLTVSTEPRSSHTIDMRSIVIVRITIGNIVVIFVGIEKQIRRVKYPNAILVERDTHKSMVIGNKGARLKEVSTQSRLDMEKLFGGPVYLEIWVKVKSGWADDAATLKRLGID